jgi:hypothetical protein
MRTLEALNRTSERTARRCDLSRQQVRRDDHDGNNRGGNTSRAACVSATEASMNPPCSAVADFRIPASLSTRVADNKNKISPFFM